MKKMIALLLALLMLMTLVACGDTAPVDPTPNGGTEGESGIADTITFAYASAPFVLDPVMIPGDNATIWLKDLLFGTLVRPSSDGTKLMPYLADSWEANEDNSVYTFHLKEGVKFSDGSDVTVDDWIYSLLRARDTEESNWHTSTDAIADVTAVDEKTLQISLVAPRESFLAEIGMFNNAVQSKAHVESVGLEANQLDPMGTGPYMIKEWVTGEYLLLEKNPYYFDADKVPTQYLRFNFVSDSSARMLQLQSGEVDIINEVPFNSITELDAMDGITALGIGSTETQFVNFNCQHPIFKDSKVRQALRYATNMDTIVDLVLSGYGTKATSFMTSSGLYYNKGIKATDYDVEKAKTMLTEAGYPDGFQVEIMCRADKPAYEEIATILKEQWAQVGVDLQITVLEKSAYIEKRNNTDYDVTLLTWVDDIPHPSQICTHFFDYSKEHGIFCDYSNDEGYAILQKALVEFNETECAKLYGELQQIWFDDVPSIVLYYADIPVAMSDSIKGFDQTSLGRYRLENCYKELG